MMYELVATYKKLNLHDRYEQIKSYLSTKMNFASWNASIYDKNYDRSETVISIRINGISKEELIIFKLSFPEFNVVTPNYNIRYVILKASDITNCIEPKQSYVDRHKSFYDELEKSILLEGFRNPILVESGFVSKKYKHTIPNINDILCCARNGGSRLWVAQKHNLHIPCLVSDFNNRFYMAPPLSELAIRSHFNDEVKNIILNDHGLHVMYH